MTDDTNESAKSNGPTDLWLYLQAMARKSELRHELKELQACAERVRCELRQVRAEMAELDRKEDERRAKQMEPLNRLLAGYPDELIDD